MGTKTSVYLTEQLATGVKCSGLPLAKLIRRGLAVEPRLIEDSPGFITAWYCEVPDEGTRFQVLDDEWHEQAPDGDEVLPPVREIYKIRMTG